MAQQLGRLDLGGTALAALGGASICMGLIQLLAEPLDQVASIDVQDVAVQTTLLTAPLLISLLLLLREGPRMVRQGARLAGRHPRWRRQLWLQVAWPLSLNMIGLVPYVLAAAMLAAMATRPELDSISDLLLLLGGLNPRMLTFSLLKTVLFALATLWIALQQGARAELQGFSQTTGLSRAISMTLAVVLGLDLLWALTVESIINNLGG